MVLDQAVIGIFGKGQGREEKSVDDRFSEKLQARPKLGEDGQVVIQDIVSQDSVGISGKFIEGVQVLQRDLFIPRFKDPVAEDRADTMNPALPSLQIEKKVVFQEGRSILCRWLKWIVRRAVVHGGSLMQRQWRMGEKTDLPCQLLLPCSTIRFIPSGSFVGSS